MTVEIDKDEAHRASSANLAATVRRVEQSIPYSKVETVAVSQLRRHKANARTHGHKQIQNIADSIRRFGFCNPILIDDEAQIIAGHGRLEAANLLGLETVPVLRLSHLSAIEKRAYVIVDNRTAELAQWDPDILATELGDLLELDFDVELTGFDLDEIEVIVGISDEDPSANHGVEDDGAKEDVVEPCCRVPVSRSGDAWLLGEHRLVCGQASYHRTYARVDDAVRYWQISAKSSAILAGTTKAFAEIEEERSGARGAGSDPSASASAKREAA
jgi:ParB-like chromosome segregation protein Spo0J